MRDCKRTKSSSSFSAKSVAREGENKIDDSAPRKTLAMSRKESSARCVNMDFSKLTFFLFLTDARGFAEKGGVLVVSGFPIHHTSKCP